MVAGNTTELRDKAACIKSYDFVRKTQLYFATQNAFRFPNAHKYVSLLFQEAPEAKEAVQGKLAIVTGVTVGGAGYYMAEELAVGAEMAVILMGRNPKKLQDAADAIQKEAGKRNNAEAKLYQVQYDLDSLASAVSAAQEATKICSAEYDGKIHVLVNNAGAACPKYGLTKDGVETNFGRNALAPHVLTEKLLAPLKAAAKETYKPRLVHVASLGHAVSPDFDPNRMEDAAMAGAPEGVFVKDKDGNIQYAEAMMGPTMQYCRAKMAVVADCIALAKREPQLAVVSLHPGSIVSNFGADLGLAGKMYYYGFYLFQLSSSQGARAALRASLDPDFNSDKFQGHTYLHSDGNPWHPCDPVTMNPTTKEPYAMEDYAEKVYEEQEKLCAKLVKDYN